MVLADRRFQKRRSQLPKWIAQAMNDADMNQSVDMAVSAARRFLKTMAQPYERDDLEGSRAGKEGVVKSSWSARDLELHKQRTEESKIMELSMGVENGVKGDMDMEDVVMREAEANGDEFGDVDEEAMMEVDT